MNLLALVFSTPALSIALGLTVKDGPLRRFLGPFSVALFLFGLWSRAGELGPTERLLCCSLWLLYWIKGWALLQVSRGELSSYSPVGLLLYGYLWPGIDSSPFRVRGKADTSAARWFVFGFPTACLGVAGLFLLALHREAVSSPRLLGIGTVAAILTTIHLGYSDILSSALRLYGYPVRRLFHFPLASKSLNEFWSRRWNGPFVEMNRILFRPLVRKVLGPKETILALFIISGLLHELALSFPVGGGFGGPLLYFFLQGVGMRVERRYRLSGSRWNRIWTWSVVLLPVPLLFHQAFLNTLVLPLLNFIGGFSPFGSTETFFTALLTAAGWGHFLVLVASFQVPFRLNWGEELQRLRPLNRKLLWTYGGYIAGQIFLWGVVTLYLRAEMVGGEKSALVVCALIALFWWSRIVIDAFYFEHSDWPEGIEFILGHTCLTTLFVTLAGIYTSLLVWHTLT